MKRITSLPLRTRAPALAAFALVTALTGAAGGSARAGVLDERAGDYQWRLCPAGRFIPIRPGYTEESTDHESTEIRSDSTRLVKEGLSQFSGDVEVIQGDRALRAEVVTYDNDTGIFEAEGRAHIWESGIIWAGERATYDLNSKVSVLDEGRYWILGGRGRGNARQLSNDREADVTMLEGVDYSTCPLSDEAWRISASSIKLNHKSDRGSARNAVLRVKGVPVFYFPYVNFPISDKRKSGFLAPSYGSSNESGFDGSIPYYWNIAPNQDATITPRVMSDRGVMLGGQYRYLQPDFEGQVEFEYLPSDDLRNDEDRSLVSLRHRHAFLDNRARANIVFNNVSDDRYFSDFGNNLSVTSQRFLDRRVTLSYARPYLSAYVLAQDYQTVDETIPSTSEPYARLPQVTFWAAAPANPYKIGSSIVADTTYFDRNDSVTGARIDLQPQVYRVFSTSYMSFIPRLALQHTEYLLDDPNRVFDDNESRTVPIFSADTQFFLERQFSLFGQSQLQTLEPRIFYLLIPHVGQDDIPRFDGGRFDISFQNLFRNNRFSGRDRVGDANQIALAVTTRALDAEDGRETFRFSVGQVFYFRDREVTLPGLLEERDSQSEIVAEAATNLVSDWSARGTIHWDPDEPETEKAAVTLRYRPDFETVLNLSYRFRRAVTDIEQTDVSLRLPLTGQLAMIGRWNYSLQENRSLETIWGLEYESCCWGARLVGRRFLRNTQGEFENGFFMQVHFRGLGGFGQDPGSVLRRGIPGYVDPFE
jgi:LPS-assembly protein